MKHIGAHVKYENERDKELIKTFHNAIMSNDGLKLIDILTITVNSPCSRFWVSEERASIVLSKMFAGDTLVYMSDTKREMYQELFRRAKEKKRKYPHKSVYELAIDVTGQPAPKFYLTPQSAKVIICKIKQKWKKQRKS